MSDKVWQTVLGEIEVTISRASFNTWFKNTSLLKNEDGKVTIGVPNIFTKQQLSDKYNRQISEILEKNGVDVDDVEYKIVSERVSEPAFAQAIDIVVPRQVQRVPTRSNTSSITTHRNPTNLNPRYRFDNFVVGSNSELAYAASQAIVKSPGEKYNPFFIYGGVGLGKTHLIQAIGNEVIATHPDKHVEYVTCESFTNEFVESIRRKRNFSNKYRSADVLIIDDIQFITGKEKTQEEFFHTFNSLHHDNKQIIISSDKPPSAIPTLEARLRSRFEAGMTADISLPDYETRSAILQTKARQQSIDIPKEVIEYISNQYQTNIRELEGALTKLLAFCELRNINPSLEAAIGLLGAATTKPRHITPKQIVDKTAKFFHLDIDELCGPKRDKDIVVPRQIAMYLLRTELNLSFPKIAESVGRKDHTTAIHSIDKIEREQVVNNTIRQNIIELKEKLYA